MPALNKVILLGNLTRDPELRQTPQGTSVCKLGLAVNRQYTTSSGDKREDTCFVDVDVWAAQAESCANYLRKGSPALVEGRLRLDQWQDRETGARRSRLTVQAQRVQFMGPPAPGGFGSSAGGPDRYSDAGTSAPRRDEGTAPGPAGTRPNMPDFAPIDDQDGPPDPVPF